MKSKFLSVPFVDFYVSFFEKSLPPPSVIHKLLLFDSSLNCELNQSANTTTNTGRTFIIDSFPDYLKFELKGNSRLDYSVIKPGMAVNLSAGYASVEDYLRRECSTNFRKVTNRSLRRLEACFNIRYERFHGDISKAQCNRLMDHLYNMIVRRFDQKKGRNNALGRWNYFVDLAYHGVNNKTASLLVIYDEEKPISISLNYHRSGIVVGSVSSFDLDYSKFSLGNLEIYKNIEWCIENNMTMFDIGFGDFDYKRKWCNLNYEFKNYYISNRKSIKNDIAFFIHDKKSRLIYYLVDKKINNLIFDTLNKLKGKQKKVEKILELSELETADLNNFQFSENPMNINENSFIKRPLFDFAYKHQERINYLKIYPCSKDATTFLIKGEKTHTVTKLLSVA